MFLQRSGSICQGQCGSGVEDSRQLVAAGKALGLLLPGSPLPACFLWDAGALVSGDAFGSDSTSYVLFSENLPPGQVPSFA